MNEFERRIPSIGEGGLRGQKIDVLQVNLGARCNQHCVHCHLKASPQRTEIMGWPVMELILKAITDLEGCLIDLTGGAPELNPYLRCFISHLRHRGHSVQVRTNLTVLLEPECEDLSEFFRKHDVQLAASMPCYLEENVCAQRGDQVYPKSIKAIQRLNALGYGVHPEGILNLVYNPGGAFLPPAQAALEEDYRRVLGSRFGIVFTHLLTLTNMPIGRFRNELARQNREKDYLQLLQDSFNPLTVPGLMCRRQVSVGWDGTLYDCDFNLALGLPIDHGAPDHIRSFRAADLRERRIVTGEHCFGCTAGAGSSCGGALA